MKDVERLTMHDEINSGYICSKNLEYEMHWDTPAVNHYTCIVHTV